MEGRVVVLTGGAAAFAHQMIVALCETGATVCITGRSIERMERLAGDFAREGHTVHPFAMDQAKEETVLACRDAVVERFGRVDVLVNNAVSRPMKKGFEDDISTFAESMATNATGIFAVSRAFGDVMIPHKSGSIINIASIQGVVGPDGFLYEGTPMVGWYPDYFFHKGGMVNFTRFLGSYYGRFGIRANCLVPGGGESENLPESFRTRYEQRTFLGRMLREGDLKGVLVLLASDASQYITGAVIPVDGGYTAK